MSSDATCDYGEGGGLQLGTFPPKYYSRWIVLAFFLVAEAFFGFNYSIGLYTEVMKEDLNLSLVQVALVASFGLLCSCMGFFVGLLMNVVKSNTYRSFLLSSSFFGSGGLLWFYMILSNQIPASFASVCAAWASANLGISIFMTCSCQVNVKNFPQKDRGKLCGLAVGIYGASSAVVAELFSLFFDNQDTGTTHEALATFTLYLSIVLFVVVCLSAIPSNFVCPSHIDYVPEHAQGIVPSFTPFLIWGYGLLVILAAITVVDLMEIFTTVSNIVVGSSLLFFIFCGYAIPSLYGSAKVSTLGPDNMLKPGADPVLASLPSEHVSEQTVEEGSTVSVSTSDAQPCSLEPPWYDAFLYIKYWVLLLLSFVIGGSTSFLFININLIVVSLGIDFNPAFVALLGVANAIARVHSGHLADILNRHCIPRSCIIFVAFVVTAGNNFLLSIGSPSYLYVGLALGNLCYGYYASLLTGLMADYFGTTHYAINNGATHLAFGLCSFVFPAGLLFLFYRTDESGFCMGRECFQDSFIILGCSCAVCALMAFSILVKPDYAHMWTQKPTKSTSDVARERMARDQ